MLLSCSAAYISEYVRLSLALESFSSLCRAVPTEYRTNRRLHVFFQVSFFCPGLCLHNCMAPCASSYWYSVPTDPTAMPNYLCTN